jgi:hypothetical protein
VKELSDRAVRMFISEGSMLMTTFPFPVDCSFSLSSEYWVRLGVSCEIALASSSTPAVILVVYREKTFV